MDRREVVSETIKEALERGIMTEFLTEHGDEVAKIMLETNDYYFMKYIEGVRESALAEGNAEGVAAGRAEGKAEGRAEGRAEGKAEGRAMERETIKNRIKTLGLSEEMVSFLLGSLIG